MIILALLGCIENKIVNIQYKDIYTQPDSTDLDILIALDRSVSMYSSADNPNLNDFSEFIYNFNILIEYLNYYNFNYHIGFITTDGNIRPGEIIGCNNSLYITRDNFYEQFNIVKCFLTETELNTGESGLDSIGNAINNSSNNLFFRDNTNLDVVIISDESDTSNFWNTNKLIDSLNSYQGTSDLQFSSVIAFPDSLPCSNFDADGKVYSDISSVFGGQVENICLINWPSFFSNLVEDRIDSKLTYTLLRTPKHYNNISVSVHNQVNLSLPQKLNNNEWSYNSIDNTITINWYYSLGDVITVTY